MSVDRWKNCLFSTAFGSDGEDGHALREQGYQGYGCDNVLVVYDASETQKILDGQKLIRIAVIHQLGRSDDPEVIQALNETCGDCKWFVKKSQRVS